MTPTVVTPTVVSQPLGTVQPKPTPKPVVVTPTVVTPKPPKPYAWTQTRVFESDWQKIEITDLPTTTPGKYQHTSNDFKTNNQKLNACAPLKELYSVTELKQSTALPEYWISLGKLVVKGSVGRCFGCAAAAVYKLVLDPACEAAIEVVGNKDYDHHFVIVGRSNLLSSNPASGLEKRDEWGDWCFVIDIWQGNLHRKAGDKFETSCYAPKTSDYTLGKMVSFCVLWPKDRAKHRKFAEELSL